MKQEEKIRLSKLMGMRGICSRREADRYIEKGWVFVDHQKVFELGTKVHPHADITLSKLAQQNQEKKVTLILHKPIGYVSTQAEKGYKEAIELITKERQFDRAPFSPSMTKNLHVAGRLDIDSKGLLIFSQDGRVIKHIIGPDSHVEKEYLVSVEGSVTPDILKKLSHGLVMDGKPLKKAKVEKLDHDLLRMTLTEGKKRQIRRMCDLVGLKVTKLKRTRIGPIRLGNLPEGKWKFYNGFF